MEFRLCLLILAIFPQIASTDSNDTDYYLLPPNKVYIEPCQREALRLHPGMINNQRIVHLHGDFWVRYDIAAHDGSEWVVLCNLANGKIIREQKLIDDAF